jgi:two-component system cell cycle response regulator
MHSSAREASGYNAEMALPLRGMNVLVADDSPTVLAAVRETLLNAGATVRLASDGAAAVRTAMDTLPDAIVLDIGMDGINGYHASRLLRNEPSTSDIPILILTGQDAASARFWGTRAGADTCLLKDDGLEQLVPAILLAREQRRKGARATAERRTPVSPTSDADLLERLATLLDRELFKATILNDVSALAEQMDDLPATLEQLGEVLRRVVDAPFAALVHDAPPGLFALFRPDIPAENLWNLVWSGTSRPEWAPAYLEGRELYEPRVSEPVSLPGLEPRFLQAAPHWEFVYFLRPGGSVSVESAELLRLFAQSATLVVSNARLHAEAQRFALTDDLTGVFNRRYVQGRLEVELERSMRTGGTVSLIVLDLDEFRKINDDYGHLVGDAALRETAQSLSRILRPYDLIGRFGGEEFVILAPDTPIEGALRLAERARATVENLRVPGAEARLTASFGVTVARRGEPDIDALFRRADDALDRAKQAGRNRVEAWTG